MVERVGISMYLKGAPCGIHAPDDGARYLPTLFPMPGQFGMPGAAFRAAPCFNPPCSRNMKWRALCKRHQLVERLPEESLFENVLPAAQCRYESRRDQMFQ